MIPGIGRLVDSAGAMVYYGTDIDRAPWRDLIGRVLQFNRERNAQETFYSPAAQAAALAALPAQRRRGHRRQDRRAATAPAKH